MFYVYGIVDAPRFDAKLRGHQGAEVMPITCGDIAAAVSALGHEIAPEPRAVWRHEQVLQSLMRRHAVLPLRFGTLAGDRETLRRVIARLQPVLSRDFDRLRGNVEFAVRVKDIGEMSRPACDDEDKGPFAPGTGYLRAKAALLRARGAREAAARSVEHELRRHLDPHAVETAWEIVQGGDVALTASYLVGRDDIAPFFDALDQVRRRHPQLHVSCTGPWAPYSFVASNATEAWQ
jgi:hypothetical protein